MNISLETLPLVLAFLLPGFLTSRLLTARTPIITREPSALVEFLESLLRSIYIQLAVGTIFVIIFYRYSLSDQDLALIINMGLIEYFLSLSLNIIPWLFGWFLCAYLVAGLLGYYWDPLDYFSKRLSRSKGIEPNDPWYSIRDFVSKARDTGHPYYQFWLQARMKTGYTYRGEFKYVGFSREDGMRELYLRNVKFFPYTAQVDDESQVIDYDGVFLDTSDCISIEVLFGEMPPPEEKENTE